MICSILVAFKDTYTHCGSFKIGLQHFSPTMPSSGCGGGDAQLGSAVAHSEEDKESLCGTLQLLDMI